MNFFVLIYHWLNQLFSQQFGGMNKITDCLSLKWKRVNLWDYRAVKKKTNKSDKSLPCPCASSDWASHEVKMPHMAVHFFIHFKNKITSGALTQAFISHTGSCPHFSFYSSSVLKKCPRLLVTTSAPHCQFNAPQASVSSPSDDGKCCQLISAELERKPHNETSRVIASVLTLKHGWLLPDRYFLICRLIKGHRYNCCVTCWHFSHCNAGKVLLYAENLDGIFIIQ